MEFIEIDKVILNTLLDEFKLNYFKNLKAN